MLLLHERTREDGSIEQTFFERDGDGGLALRVEGQTPQPVPIELLIAVMKRYGHPLDPAVTMGPDAERIALAEGREVVHFRHLARYDVIARDWIVLVEPGAEPLAELANGVHAALVHLLAAMREPSTTPPM
jgi:hypothetical protein